MRVSKTVRDYIEQKVNEAYPITGCEEYEQARKEVNDFCEQLDEAIEHLVKEQVKVFNAAHPSVADWGLTDRNVCHVIYHSYDSELERKSRAMKEEIERKRAEAIQNIIVTLELGGNKADLERMLSELKQD